MSASSASAETFRCNGGDSRIPVALATGVFRRSASMRLRGERAWTLRPGSRVFCGAATADLARSPAGPGSGSGPGPGPGSGHGTGRDHYVPALQLNDRQDHEDGVFGAANDSRHRQHHHHHNHNHQHQHQHQHRNHHRLEVAAAPGRTRSLQSLSLSPRLGAAPPARSPSASPEDEWCDGRAGRVGRSARRHRRDDYVDGNGDGNGNGNGDDEEDEDDDLDSVRSCSSAASGASCEHPFVAHNGTTFSGRRMKYVVHCSAHAGQVGDEYLTPTQRAQRQIKRLRCLLHQAKQDIEQKDSDIFRLTKEVVELRLYKAALSSPDDKSNSSEAVTVRENPTDDMKTPDSPTCTDFTDDPKTPYDKSTVDMQSSFADSGHFEDLTNSKDSVHVQTCDKACHVHLQSDEDRRIAEVYERKLEELMRAHGTETQDLKQKHNEKIEELLQRLSDVNLRYGQLVPDYEQARERIQELERQLDEVNRQLQEQEERHKQLYLQMYNKGMEAAKIEQQEQVMALATQTPSRVSVSELLQQLQVTQTELENIKDTAFLAENTLQAQCLLSAKEAVSLWVLGARKAMYRRLVELKNAKNEMDPEIMLQFLKSAIYYFLTDKENYRSHLKAIQSILEFSPVEINNIDRARTS